MKLELLQYFFLVLCFNINYTFCESDEIQIEDVASTPTGRNNAKGTDGNPTEIDGDQPSTESYDTSSEKNARRATSAKKKKPQEIIVESDSKNPLIINLDSKKEKDDEDPPRKPLELITLTPIQITNSSSSLKAPIIEDMKRRIDLNQWKKDAPNTVLFTFNMPKHTMTNAEMNQIAEDIYWELKDVEPKSQIHPAHFKLTDNNSQISIEVLVNMPPLKEMAVPKTLLRFPNVKDNYIELSYKNGLDLEDLVAKVEENLEYQLYMSRIVDSGQNIVLNVPFKVKRRSGKNRNFYVILMHEITEYVKNLTGVKFLSFDTKNIDKNWRMLMLKVSMKYSVKQAHEGLGASPEMPGTRKRWPKEFTGWIWTIF